MAPSAQASRLSGRSFDRRQEDRQNPRSFIKSHILSLAFSRKIPMWIGRNLTRDLQNVLGRHHQVETSRKVRCPRLLRLDEFGRVQAHSKHVSIIYRLSFFRPGRRFGTSQWGRIIHIVSGCTSPVLFLVRTKASWDDVPSFDRLISDARSCAFMWVPVRNGPDGQVKLSKSTASPWATNGHPRIPLTLGRDNACRSPPPSWMQPSILALESLRACRPTFPFIQLLPVYYDPSSSDSLPQVP